MLSKETIEALVERAEERLEKLSRQPWNLDSATEAKAWVTFLYRLENIKNKEK